MTTIIFQEIKQKKTLQGLCRVCNRKRTRTITEEQTVNPFNKNEDGTIKSYFEVVQSVRETLEKRIKRFQDEGFVCRKCKEFLGY
jgi:hypothetical protein